MSEQFNSLFPTVNQSITAAGHLRVQASDFVVIEHHDMTFTGVGEHWWFKIQKTNSNTAWVATQLASACKIPARQVGYAGLKDRHAVTQQWFSVQLPKIKDLAAVKDRLPDEVEIIEEHWHQSKIKTGQLKHNEFNLIIRDMVGDKQSINEHIERVKQQGVPNYFGPQRFGHHMGNVTQAEDWFSGRRKINNKKMRGLLLSTARSHIFNTILAERIKTGYWLHPMTGDIVQLDQSHSWFPITEAETAELNHRLNTFDLHLTAALWGDDELPVTDQCAEFEQHIADQFPLYQQGLAQHRLKHDRRAMRLQVNDLQYQWDQDDLKLYFKLVPGAYATSVVREICHTTDRQAETS